VVHTGVGILILKIETNVDMEVDMRKRDGTHNTDAVHRGGFTLIELLMVVLVIAIMLSSIFALAAFTNNRSKRAQAIASLEGLRGAIEEYFATFGVYPPTKAVDWSHVCVKPDWDPPGLDWGLHTGLYYHLYVGAQHDRWKTYLKDVNISGGAEHKGVDDLDVGGGAVASVTWTNCSAVIIDPWGRAVRYEVGANYQSYTLYSTGPDGVTNTPDDVGNDSFTY
jgi:prepilin-type N-terminal cleavage/methylation domain-containing protein